MEFKLCILVGKDQGQSINLETGKIYKVGRHSENDIIIEDRNTSRNHFKIQIKNDKYYITDLCSKNGTFIEGRELKPLIETEVREGVPIVIGMTIIGFGAMCERCLKPFLDSAGLSKEVDETGVYIKPARVNAIKRNLEFIYNMNRSFMESKSPKEIFSKLLDGIFNLFKRIDRCVIIAIDDQTGGYSNIIYRSRRPVDDPHKLYNKELVKQALIMNRPVMVKDSNKKGFEDEKVTESLQLMNIRSAMCVPITSCYSIRGVIYIDSLSRPKGFRENDLDLLKDISGRAALALDNVSIQMGFTLWDHKGFVEFLNTSDNKYQCLDPQTNPI